MLQRLPGILVYTWYLVHTRKRAGDERKRIARTLSIQPAGTLVGLWVVVLPTACCRKEKRDDNYSKHYNINTPKHKRS